MNQIILIAIIFIVFYIISVVGIIFLSNLGKIRFFFQNRHHRDKLIKCFFIMPNSVINIEYIVHDENNLIDYEKGKYVINKELGLFDDTYKLMTMAYIFGNPNPINLKNLGKNQIPDIDSESLKLALKQKFVRDLLTESTRSLILMIMVGVNIIISIIIALKVFGVFDKK